MRIPKEPTDPIEIYGHRIHWEFNHMVASIEYSNKGLKLQKKSVWRKHERMANKDPVYWQGIYEARDEQLARFDQNYLNILRASFFVASYSLLEACFVKICILSQPLALDGVSFKKGRGKSYIESCRDYMENNLNVNLQHLNQQWKFIDDAREIRNVITHESSRLPGLSTAEVRKSKVYKILRKIDSMEINAKARIFKIQDNDFLLDFCEVSRTYLRGVVKSYLNDHRDKLSIPIT